MNNMLCVATICYVMYISYPIPLCKTWGILFIHDGVHYGRHNIDNYIDVRHITF